MFFPPNINNFQPAFTPVFPYEINFSLSKFTSLNEIKHIQIRIVYQNNNSSIINTEIYPDGIIYKSIDEIQFSGINGIISINQSDLKKKNWDLDTYYKVQIRFGNNSLWYDTGEKFADWKSKSIEQNSFSEWSSVMILKCITTPTVYIKNSNPIEFSINPIIYGAYNNNNGTELENLYKFEIYKEDEIIEDSGWLQHNRFEDNESNLSEDSYRINTKLELNQNYSVVYYIETENYYVGNSSAYNFQVQNFSLNELKGIQFLQKENSEEGIIEFYITSEKELTGNFVITRSDEKDNFISSADIYKFSLFNERLNNKLIFIDKTIENGVSYQYSLVQEQMAENRTLPITNEIITPYFENTFLVGENKQLNLKFNTKINNLSKNLLVNKYNTLGGKYPVLQKNGDTYYTSFSISGLISAFSDQYNLFSNLVINDIDLTNENLLIEKKFRNLVEEFLNKDNYKLFRSPTEGNIIIYLTNVNLTPKDELNRFLYEFSATAYEIKDFNLENLKNYYIYDSGEFLDFDNMNNITELNGQLSGNFYNKNILDELKKEINMEKNGILYQFNKIKKFSIEADSNLILQVNNQDILIPFGKPYVLEDIDINNLYVKSDTNIIFNYLVEIKLTQTNINYLNKDYITYSTWNQITGLYSKSDLLSEIIIKTKQEVENKFYQGEQLDNYIEEYNLYTNSIQDKFYFFIGLNYLDIEAQEGTIIEVTNNNDIKEQIVIGPTNYYKFSKFDNIKGIKILNGSYLIINYKASSLYSI